LLTGEQNYPEPYNFGIAKAGSRLDLLKQLTLDNSRQQTRLDLIQILLAKKLLN